MNHTFHLPDYAVFLGPLEETLPAWLQQQQHTRNFVVTDCNADTHCLDRTPLADYPRVVVGLDQDIAVDRVGAMEQLKCLESCELIWDAMFRARLDRNALVINLGGGVIGDMGGFCAATYKRGVDFIQVPTSLLAMTDAAIGGKLGIDFRGIKNGIGVFQSPAAVFIDPAFLRTLPLRELRSGFAEIVKHALIGDPALWTRIRQLTDQLAQPADWQALRGNIQSDDWLKILESSIAVKTQVVAIDPHEHGLRALLNFGHTIGHAIESYFLQTDTPLTHGEAIAIGMICEAPHTDTYWERAADTILNLFGHHPIPETAFADLWTLMLQDKKNTSGHVRIAVPNAEPYSMQLIELTPEAAAFRLRHYNKLGK
ncbi:MAG: 3-dehydroquinate synthase [Bacteroidetes bacterium]|nr:MAG: 3-dehydroquinate synthase [Bacteroidota bacterium]